MSFFLISLESPRKRKWAKKLENCMSCLTWAALHGNGKKEWLKHGFLHTCTKKTKTCHLFFAAFRTSFAKIRIVAQLSFCPSVSNGMFAWLWNAFFGFFWIASVFVRSLTFTIVLLVKWDPRGPPPPNWKVPKAFFQSGFVWKILMQREHKFKVLINRRTTGHHCCFGGV